MSAKDKNKKGKGKKSEHCAGTGGWGVSVILDKVAGKGLPGRVKFE